MILILQLLAYLLMVTANVLANILPLNGQTTGGISKNLDVLFTPAGYVFSIWGLIYILLGMWIVRQFPEKRRNLPIYKRTSILFILTCILNSLWIFAWHYEYFRISVFVMISLLIALISLYRKAKNSDPDFLDIAPFSTYLAWISVATIANSSYYLVYIGLIGTGPPEIWWTYIMLAFSAALALMYRIKNDDWVYPLVFVWAFIGIGINNFYDYPNVAFTAYFLTFFTAAGVMLATKITISYKFH
ncbi:hypothetical protein DFO73_113190 [Cytobacillus oceanisediminis]|uniref:TspO/MBR related protein n=1 Tax=Cytobacillus oceanisediminis TaxID=665099 RepID=A0A2V2ZPB8_9BACI|nr:TspO/MBR family protein [Cytobacillus oceanisediminis]PWW25589.1 hypothetical protein DFO73_113190 [Cytobacillus oceanisediminis]